MCSSPGMPFHGCASVTSQCMSRSAALASSCSSALRPMASRSTASPPCSSSCLIEGGWRTARLRTARHPFLMKPTCAGAARIAPINASTPPASTKAMQLSVCLVVSIARNPVHDSSAGGESVCPPSSAAHSSGARASHSRCLTASLPASAASKAAAGRSRGTSCRCARSSWTHSSSTPRLTSFSQILFEHARREQVSRTEAAAGASPSAENRRSSAASSGSAPASAAARARSNPLLSATRASS
mmetsp:Transcript_9303/g.24054  ORF Transcript_9303/g.24054 Transcript_9303/m.24054 type:complete len:243 (-) Transcript_9303:959-1687(-)